MVPRHARACRGHPRLYGGAIKKGVDGRDIGERSDAVLRTALPGHDELRSSLARRRILDLELAHLARHDEVVVVERERPRDPVLVELEADRIDRRLLAALRVVAVEIADR